MLLLLFLSIESINYRVTVTKVARTFDKILHTRAAHFAATVVGILAISSDGGARLLTIYRHIKTAEQRTVVIQQYSDWYSGH